jgi:DNA-binding MarR family transcriptional regulator
MKLEDEIFNKAFENQYHKLVVNMLFTASWMTNNLKKELDNYSITTQQFNVLRILRGQHPNPASINLIKERMLDKMSDASRIVDRLEKKKLLTRVSNQADRRSVDIHISEKGLELLQEIKIEVAMDKIITKNITEPEALQLNDLMDKLRG